MLTELWSDELHPRGVAVHAMHPGWAETPGVARSLPGFFRLTRPFLRTPAEGADTIVWLAAAPEAALASGGLWLDRERHPAAIFPGTAGSPEERKRLVEELERVTGEPSGGAARVRKKTSGPDEPGGAALPGRLRVPQRRERLGDLVEDRRVVDGRGHRVVGPVGDLLHGAAQDLAGARLRAGA